MRSFRCLLHLALTLGGIATLLPSSANAQGEFKGEYTGYYWRELHSMFPHWGGMDIEFLPDGRYLVAATPGIVKIFSGDGVYISDVYDIRDEVCMTGDTGLFGILVDPDFDNTPWLYLHYAVDTDPANPDTTLTRFNRVIRVRLDAGTNYTSVVADSRQYLIGETWSQGILSDGTFHTTGCMQWGTDGTLLISNGDSHNYGMTWEPSNTPEYGPGRFPTSMDIGPLRAQSYDNANGKIIRIDRRTGKGLPSNPFWNGDPDAWQSKIWVLGLRMPWRFSALRGNGSHDPAEGRPGALWIGDVGWDSYDELNVSSVSGGNNFGWPFWEGNIPPPLSPFDQDSYAGPIPHVPFAETSLDVAISHKMDTLPHFPSALTAQALNSSSITGGVQYDWKDYKPLNIDPPYSELMDGKYLFADWGAHTLYAANLSADHRIESISLIADGLIYPAEPGEGIVDLNLDPVTGRIFASTFWRVWALEFNPEGAPPVARLVADANSGPLPLGVNFDASASTNPSGTPIESYTWFVDDTVLESTTTPAYRYDFDEDRNYDFGVGVTNSYNLTSTTTLKVYAGNKAPKARITAPDPFTKYPADGTHVDVAYSGEASDEDGAVELVRWNLSLGHNLHRHELVERTGDLFGLFNLYASDDANSWFIIELTVTDDRGQSITDAVNVYKDGEGPLRIAWMLH